MIYYYGMYRSEVNSNYVCNQVAICYLAVEAVHFFERHALGRSAVPRPSKDDERSTSSSNSNKLVCCLSYSVLPTGISTAVDAEAVAAKALEKEQIKSSWTLLWAERLVTEITMATKTRRWGIYPENLCGGLFPEWGCPLLKGGRHLHIIITLLRKILFWAW